MNSINKIKSFVNGMGLIAVLSGGILFASATRAMAHDTKCPYCQMAVIQDTKDQDNEVALKYGNKKIEYRCVMCAIAHAKTRYKDKADLTIVAPSPIKDKKVTIARKNGVWSSSPADAMFVFQKGGHDKCQELYRSAPDKASADAWIAKSKLKDAKILNLKEMVEASK